MDSRQYWVGRVEQLWKRRPVVWLNGVRRVGKTVLCQSLSGISYYDCERPAVRNDLRDPDAFWASFADGARVCLDEIHRLDNPSEVLKLAADYYPRLRVIATGSSTLGASAKFKDTLTDRKGDLWLTPMIHEDLMTLGRGDRDMDRRLHRGGLPGFFLDDDYEPARYVDWLDSYWAKDVLELFRLERRASFLRFVELLMIQGGGLFEATKYARPCEVSRTTIMNYLAVLEATHVALVLRPFTGHNPTEIVSAPKVYGFDTGFVCAFRGIERLRPDDRGPLWELYVLNEILAHAPLREIRYWRDKQQREIDFVWARTGRPPIAIECKWSFSGFDPRNLLAFRRLHPKGENWVVARDVERSRRVRVGGLIVEAMNLPELKHRLVRPRA